MMTLVGAPTPQVPIKPPVWVEDPSVPIAAITTGLSTSTTNGTNDHHLAAAARRERRRKEYEARRREYEEMQALLQSAEVVSQGVDCYFQHCVMGRLDAMDEDPFTLESFESLMRTHAARGKDFILARVTTQDPLDADKRYHSYYGAHQINKVLFRTQPEKGLLHRMKARNPLNNMLIVGDVHYYSISAEQVNKIRPVKGSTTTLKSSAASILSSLSRKSRCSKLAAKAIAEDIGCARSSPLLGDADSDDSALFASSGTEADIASGLNSALSRLQQSSALGRRHHYRSSSVHSVGSHSSTASCYISRITAAAAASSTRPSRLRQAVIHADNIAVDETLDPATENGGVTMSPSVPPCGPSICLQPTTPVVTEPTSSAAPPFQHTIVHRLRSRSGTISSIDSGESDTSHISHVSGCSTATHQSSCSCGNASGSESQPISHNRRRQHLYGDVHKWHRNRRGSDDSSHEERVESEKSEDEERVEYKFQFLATDDDYLLKASIRQVFKLNALEPWDAVLFTISSNALYDYSNVPQQPPIAHAPPPQPAQNSQPSSAVTTAPAPTALLVQTTGLPPSRSATTQTPVTPRGTTATPRSTTSFTSNTAAGVSGGSSAPSATAATSSPSPSAAPPQSPSARSIISRLSLSLNLMPPSLTSPRGGGGGGSRKNSPMTPRSFLSAVSGEHGIFSHLRGNDDSDHRGSSNSAEVPLPPPPPLPVVQETLPPLDVMPSSLSRLSEHTHGLGQQQQQQQHRHSHSLDSSTTSSTINSQESLLQYHAQRDSDIDGSENHADSDDDTGDDNHSERVTTSSLTTSIVTTATITEATTTTGTPVSTTTSSLSGTMWSPRTRARMEAQQQHSLALARAHAHTRSLLNERRAAHAAAMQREFLMEEEADAAEAAAAVDGGRRENDDLATGYGTVTGGNRLRGRPHGSSSAVTSSSVSGGRRFGWLSWWPRWATTPYPRTGQHRHARSRSLAPGETSGGLALDESRQRVQRQLSQSDGQQPHDHHHRVSTTAVAAAAVTTATTARYRHHPSPTSITTLEQSSSHGQAHLLSFQPPPSISMIQPGTSASSSSSSSLSTASSSSPWSTTSVQHSFMEKFWAYASYPPAVIGGYALVGICIVHVVAWPVFAGIMAGLLVLSVLLIYMAGHHHTRASSIHDVYPASSGTGRVSWRAISRGSGAGHRMTSVSTTFSRAVSAMTLRSAVAGPRETVQQTHSIEELESEESHHPGLVPPTGSRNGDGNIAPPVMVDERSLSQHSQELRLPGNQEQQQAQLVQPQPQPQPQSSEGEMKDDSLHDENTVAADSSSENYHGAYMHMHMSVQYHEQPPDGTIDGGSTKKDQDGPADETKTVVPRITTDATMNDSCERNNGDDNDDAQSMVSAFSTISEESQDYHDLPTSAKQDQPSPLVSSNQQPASEPSQLPFCSPPAMDDASRPENLVFLCQPPSQQDGYGHRRQPSSPLLDRVLVASQLESHLAASAKGCAGVGGINQSEDHVKLADVIPAMPETTKTPTPNIVTATTNTNTTATTTTTATKATTVSTTAGQTTTTAATVSGTTLVGRPLTPVTPLTPRTLRARETDLEQGQAIHC
ncbi:hypothetical protein BGZ73_004114 [Actinomortierella ambigua]|nr:hypothetical protein BGZ73_004114 [Actinomortierella ambigua]